MYTIQDLDREITAKVSWLEDHNGDELHKDWLINAVMSEHSDIHGEDADFALCGGRFAVEKRVEAYFRNIKENEEAEEKDPQLRLPGYEKLQKRYIVERDEKQVGVAIWSMTDEEIDWKAEQHRAMGRGHFAHADELVRFKEARRANGAATA